MHPLTYTAIAVARQRDLRAAAEAARAAREATPARKARRAR
jgi:hypothetical protein